MLFIFSHTKNFPGTLSQGKDFFPYFTGGTEKVQYSEAFWFGGGGGGGGRGGELNYRDRRENSFSPE